MNIVQLYIVHKTHCCKINIKQVLHVYHKSYNLIRLVENNVGQKQPWCVGALQVGVWEAPALHKRPRHRHSCHHHTQNVNQHLLVVKKCF